jgi:hypothetical protein
LHRTEQVVVEHLLTKTPTSVKTEYLGLTQKQFHRLGEIV